jgi:hypothetical protein
MAFKQIDKDFELKTRVDEDTWVLFAQLAALVDRSNSEYLRRLVEDHCHGLQRRLHALKLHAVPDEVKG